MEKYKLRRSITAACLVLLGGTACAVEQPDYEGIGDEFRVRGVISDVTDDSIVRIHENKLIVLDSSGKAVEWFPERKGQDWFSEEFSFDDNYRDKNASDSFWDLCGDDKFVGAAHDMNGQEIDPQQLKPGQVVEIDGKIRESSYWQSNGKSGYCAHEDVAVYDTVQVIDEPLTP